MTRSSRPAAVSAGRLLFMALPMALPVAAVVALLCSGTQAHAGNGKGALALIPADASMVLVVDAEKARGTALGKWLVLSLSKRDKVAAAIGTLGADGGFDVNKDLQTVVLVMTGTGTQTDRMAFFIEGRFDRDKIIALARKEATTATRSHRDVEYLVIDDKTAMAFPGDHLVLAPVAVMPRLIDVQRRKARSLARTGALRKLVRESDTGDEIWGALLLPEELRATIAGKAGGHGVDAILASIRLSAGPGMKVRLRLDASSDAAASAILALLSAKQSSAATDRVLIRIGLDRAVSAMSISRSGRRVDMTVALSDRDLAKLKALLALAGW